MTGEKSSDRRTRQNITTVSLLSTWEIKQNLVREGGNFSRFVRNCLREWARYEQQVECAKEKYEDREILCFPRESRLCVKCWPDGPPPPYDWKEYVGQDLGAPGSFPTDEQKKSWSDRFHNDEWILDRAKEYNTGGDSWSVKDLPWRGRPPRARLEKDKKRPFQWIRRLLRGKKTPK